MFCLDVVMRPFYTNIILILNCLLLGELKGQSVMPDYQDHVDLAYYLTEHGQKRAVKTQTDWEIRKPQIKLGMQKVMGPFPKPDEKIPLSLEVLEEVAESSFTRRLVSYHTDSLSRRVQAYLFLPKATVKLPAVLCLHQTTAIGKKEPAGLGGNPQLHYARHLAERGFVTLAPDYPSFGDYPYQFPAEDGYISGTMKAIYDNHRAIDLLQELNQVDPENIGCIGHSLGGHNTIFTGVFDTRIKAMVSNCGFTRFHKYYNGNLKGWTSDRYMPLIAKHYNSSPEQVPFDFPELIGSLAPRAFLASAPVRDGNFEVSGVKETIAEAKKIYQLYGVTDNLEAIYPNAAHSFPEEAREKAYRFLDKHLKK